MFPPVAPLCVAVIACIFSTLSVLSVNVLVSRLVIPLVLLSSLARSSSVITVVPMSTVRSGVSHDSFVNC